MYYIQLWILVAVNCLLALASYVTLGAGLMVICFGAFFGVGAVVAAVLHSTYELPLPVAISLSGMLCAICGIAMAVLFTRLRGFEFAIATLGLGELVRIIATNMPDFGGALGFSRVSLDPQPILATAILCFIGVCFWVFERSQARRALALIRSSEIRAITMGIDVRAHRWVAVGIGALLAGIAGGIYIHTVGLVEPESYGFAASVQVLLFAIIGGTKDFKGPLIAATLLTAIPEVLRFSPALRMVLYGTCLVATAVFLPDGISGWWKSRVASWQHAR